VRTVEIETRWHKAGIRIPHRTDIAIRWEPEVVRVLSQPVEIRIHREGGPKAHILGLEDELGTRGVEEDVSSGFARDSEVEWAFCEGKLECSVGGRRILGSRSRKDRLGDLVDILFGIFDLHMQT
jgi:hypothetical protein